MGNVGLTILLMNNEGNGADADTILYVDVVPVSRPAQGADWSEYWRIK